MLLRNIFIFSFLVINATTALADLSTNPYNPVTDKLKLASDLGIGADDIALDRRCVFTKTEAWMAFASLKDAWTCVLVLTGEQLILSVFDGAHDRHKTFLKYSYSDLQQVSLRVDVARNNISYYADGKKIQLQMPTKDGYISITAFRGKMGDRPFDWRGGQDAFDILKTKGIPEYESPGLVELEAAKSFTLFKR